MADQKVNISVSADVSGAERSIKGLGNTINSQPSTPAAGASGPQGRKGGQAPPSGKQAELDSAVAREAAARRALTQRFNKTFTDSQVSQIARDFAEMSRSSTRLKRFGGDLEKWMNSFRQTFPSGGRANRHYSEVMNQLGVSPQYSGGAGGMFRTAGRAMMNATGAGGGVFGSIMGQASQNASETDGGAGSAAGMGMLGKGALIGAAAYMGVKTIQKVGQKIGDAQDEAIHYHDLRQSVGNAAVGFDELKDSVSFFTANMGVLSGKTAELADRYTKSSLVFGTEAGAGIGAGVGAGVSLSRSYGLAAPEAGVDFLASMRRYKVASGSTDDNRKLAYMIGDAVGNTGAFSKADDVLGAISHFVESTTRSSYNPANVGGYADMLGRLGSLKLPGMDAQGAASMMQKVASSWATPNGGSDAGQFSRLDWAQKTGVDATTVGAINDAGPMATYGSTFGPDSALFKNAEPELKKQFAEIYASAVKQGLADKPFQDQEIESLTAKHGKEWAPLALKGQYSSLSYTEAIMLSRATSTEKGGMGEFRNRVAGRVGEGIANTDDIKRMADFSQIDVADDKELAALKAKYLKEHAKGSQKAALASATDPEEVKKILTQIAATRNTTDKGEEARTAQVNLDRQFQAYASSMIPLTTAIQQGIFALLPKVAMSRELQQVEADLNYQRKIERTGGNQEKIDKINARAIDAAKRGPMADEEYLGRSGSIRKGWNAFNSDEKKAEMAALDKERKRRNAIVPSAVKSLIVKQAEETARGTTAERGDLTSDDDAAKLLNEMLQNARPNIRPRSGGAGVRNMRNNNPGNIESGSFANSHGATGTDGRFAIFPDKETGSRAMDALLGQYGKKGINTIDGIVRKWAPAKENGEGSTAAYVDAVAKETGYGKTDKLDMSDPAVIAAIAKAKARREGDVAAYVERDAALPDAARPASGGQVATVNINLDGTLKGPNGTSVDMSKAASAKFQQTHAGVSRG